MEISLSPELARFLAEKIQSGQYADAQAVIDEGIRLLKLRDDAVEKWREQIERGWSDLQAGNVVDGTSAMEAIRRSLVELPAGVAMKVDKALRDAIRGLHVVELVGGGHTRVGEPHDYGILNGKPTLLFYQTAGYTRSGGLPQWRHIRVEQVSVVRVLTSPFNGRRPSQKHVQWDKLFLRVPA